MFPIDGSAIIPDDEYQITDYNEKVTKAFALFCEHLIHAQLAHSILRKCQKRLGDILRCPWSQDYKKQIVSLKEVLHHQNARKGRLVCTYQHGEVFANQLRSIEMKIKDGDVYMVLLMNFLPSFDKLVTSLESMSTKDIDLQFIVVRLFHEVSKKKM